MKNLIYIFSILLFLCSCSEKEKTRLPTGNYYARYWRHSDTIFFKPYTSETTIIGWTELFWVISEDSIIQDDTRGMSYYSCTEKSSYQLTNDTLTLLFKRSDQNNKEFINGTDIVEKYKIEQLLDTSLILVKIHKTIDRKAMRRLGRRSRESEIQLR